MSTRRVRLGTESEFMHLSLVKETAAARDTSGVAVASQTECTITDGIKVSFWGTQLNVCKESRWVCVPLGSMNSTLCERTPNQTLREACQTEYTRWAE